jgi:hypothetical protein
VSIGSALRRGADAAPRWRAPRHSDLHSAAAVAIAALIVIGAARLGWAAPADYVIQISLDGMRGDLLEAALDHDSTGSLPAFHRLVREGATTFNARSDYSSTSTLPNHTTMLTGRPVSRPVGQPATVAHGWTANGKMPPGTVLHGTGNPAVLYIASVFDVVHDAGLSTALYASKAKFALFDTSWDAAHGAPDTLPPDNGRDKIDRFVYVEPDSELAARGLHAAVIADLHHGPAHFTFVHYADMDAVGHDFGWESAAWQLALRRVDGYLGDILAVVDSSSILAGHTALVITADHGGDGEDHADAKYWPDYTIPFLLWGAGVPDVRSLYALGGTRANPVATRPDYNYTHQPIRNGDAANLVLHLLGLGPVPGSTINAGQDLGVQHLHERGPGRHRAPGT